MIKMTYFLVPNTDLAYRFLYTLEGEVNTEWNFGAIGMWGMASINTIAYDKMMKDFVIGEAALIKQNLSGKTGGELGMFKDTKVELFEVGLKTKDEYPPIESSPDIAPGLHKTDSIIVEYAHLPKTDMKLYFMLRMLTPIDCSWSVFSVDPMTRRVELSEDGVGSRQFNSHLGVEDTIRRDIVEYYKNMVMSASEGRLPKELEWMEVIEQVELRECSFAPISECQKPDKVAVNE